VKFFKQSGWIVLALGLLAAGCGDDPVTPAGAPGSDGQPVDLGPFHLIDVFLRPYAIQRPSPAGGGPAPSLAEHYLSGFYSGGTQLASFEWDVPASIGTVEPKTLNLTRSDATVVVRLREDGNLPLGFFTVNVRARSGADSSSMQRHFAVVENTWIKHQRSGFTGDPPEALVSYPAYLTHANLPASADSIFFVLSSSSTTIRIRRIAAEASLSAQEQVPDDCLLRPLEPELNNYDAAPKTMPDLAPPALGRREMLFSSTMDPQWPARCGGVTGACSNKPGLRLWVVTTPAGITNFFPRVLTTDSTYTVFGRTIWYAYNFLQPKWDPKATNPAARVAFMSDLAGTGITELWLADLLDRNGDNRSDTLVNFRDLTPGLAVNGYDWHPDGTRLCVSGRGLSWVDAGSGAVTSIPIPDSSLTHIGSPSVFWRQGEHTLIAFQAEAENLRNLYVLDTQDKTLTRLLPYSVSVTHNLFPRWHPTRKELIYVCDYTVMPWANTAPGSSLADRLNPNNPELYGMQRTYYPSVWRLRLE
jgi:hypothetical protein